MFSSSTLSDLQNGRSYMEDGGEESWEGQTEDVSTHTFNLFNQHIKKLEKQITRLQFTLPPRIQDDLDTRFKDEERRRIDVIRKLDKRLSDIDVAWKKFECDVAYQQKQMKVMFEIQLLEASKSIEERMSKGSEVMTEIASQMQLFEEKKESREEDYRSFISGKVDVIKTDVEQLRQRISEDKKSLQNDIESVRTSNVASMGKMRDELNGEIHMCHELLSRNDERLKTLQTETAGGMQQQVTKLGELDTAFGSFRDETAEVIASMSERLDNVEAQFSEGVETLSQTIEENCQAQQTTQSAVDAITTTELPELHTNFTRLQRIVDELDDRWADKLDVVLTSVKTAVRRERMDELERIKKELGSMVRSSNDDMYDRIENRLVTIDELRNRQWLNDERAEQLERLQQQHAELDERYRTKIDTLVSQMEKALGDNSKNVSSRLQSMLDDSSALSKSFDTLKGQLAEQREALGVVSHDASTCTRRVDDLEASLQTMTRSSEGTVAVANSTITSLRSDFERLESRFRDHQTQSQQVLAAKVAEAVKPLRAEMEEMRKSIAESKIPSPPRIRQGDNFENTEAIVELQEWKDEAIRRIHRLHEDLLTLQLDRWYPANRFPGDELDNAVMKVLRAMRVPFRLQCEKLSDGGYYLADKKVRMVLKNNQVMVRRGGGWVPLKDYYREIYIPKQQEQMKEMRDMGIEMPHSPIGMIHPRFQRERSESNTSQFSSLKGASDESDSEDGDTEAQPIARDISPPRAVERHPPSALARGDSKEVLIPSVPVHHETHEDGEADTEKAIDADAVAERVADTNVNSNGVVDDAGGSSTPETGSPAVTSRASSPRSTAIYIEGSFPVEAETTPIPSPDREDRSPDSFPASGSEKTSPLSIGRSSVSSSASTPRKLASQKSRPKKSKSVTISKTIRTKPKASSSSSLPSYMQSTRSSLSRLRASSSPSSSPSLSASDSDVSPGSSSSRRRSQTLSRQPSPLHTIRRQAKAKADSVPTRRASISSEPEIRTVRRASISSTRSVGSPRSSSATDKNIPVHVRPQVSPRAVPAIDRDSYTKDIRVVRVTRLLDDGTEKVMSSSKL